MRKLLLILILGFFLISFVSAGVVFDLQPQKIYNVGDWVETNLKFTPEGGANTIVTLDLVCGSHETEIYKEFLILNEEKSKEIVVPLIKDLINNSVGKCRFEVRFDGKKEASSNSFKISRLIKVNFELDEDTFIPGTKLDLIGTAVKESGVLVEGFLEGNFLDKKISEKIKDGKFTLSLKLDDDFPAGEHVFNLTAFEVDEAGAILNSGLAFPIIYVSQIPTSIEILLEKNELLPGETISGKIILHDQTGEEMEAPAYAIIRDALELELQKFELQTGEDFKYPINDSELPTTWTISAFSEELINRAQLEIKEYEYVETEIVNETLIVTNKGNVFYNNSIEIQIGDEAIKIPINLDIGEEELYSLSAPEGEYEIQVGDLTKMLTLTGKAIGVEKIDGTTSGVSPFVWSFIIFIFAFVAYLAFRKGKPKNFFARIVPKRNKPVLEKSAEVNDFVDTKKKLELSLSIVGTKQNSTVGCIAFKNYDEIKSGKGHVNETLKKINKLVESNKGLVYRSNGNLFFILAPSVTKTFKNQKPGILLMQKIKKILEEHNKKFNVRFDFGLSLNFGTIVTKDEKESVKFMSLGTLMTVAKKLATFSKGEIYFTEKIKEKIEDNLKGELVEIGNVRAYKFVELIDKDNHNTFIQGFLARQQKERLAEANKK